MSLFHKSCPDCEGDMYKQCNSDEDIWWWECEMCGHREDIASGE